MLFDSYFVWGTATASFQVEGAAYEDGKGLSIWDVAKYREGYMSNSDNGDTACDHYHRYKEDVAILKKLGVKAYRFSLSWPRIFPNGTGEINEKGIEFYNNLIDELLRNGIEPYVTLFHWDYPYELFLKGGWLNGDSPKWFAEYTKVCVKNFSDRVKNWFTLNEPQCFIGYGYRARNHAPCLGLDLKTSLIAAHNTLLAHGMSVQVIRKYSKQKCNIGWAPQGHIAYPASRDPRDTDAAERYMFSVNDKSLINNSWWMDPVYLGRYPDDGIKLYEEEMPYIGQDDMKTIKQPLDFIGINSYNGKCIAADDDKGFVVQKRPQGYPDNSAGWPLDFDMFEWGAKSFYKRYHLPILVSENGMCANDWVSLDGKVHDRNRIDCINRHVISLDKAYKSGVPVIGYFLWSFLDNLEWHNGYQKRFGLVYVDYKTKNRIIKDSGLWYADLIKNNS